MLAVSLDTLTSIWMSLIFKVLSADSPFIFGGSLMPLQASFSVGNLPPQPEYSFNVSPHGTLRSLILY